MKKIFFFILIMFPLFSIAIPSSYVCPNTYHTIMLGYSVAQVMQACGQPTTTATQQSIQTTPVQLQQWVYSASKNISRPGQVAPQLLITFNQSSQVSQISVTDEPSINNFPCYTSGRIRVGTTAQQVHLQCGQPTYINYLQQAENQPVAVHILTYTFGAYRPQMIFTFQNDQLTNIQVGQVVR